MMLGVISMGFVQAVKRPNVIIILADDMGYSDIGCFGGDARTPNLDALAAGGLKMTQFYNASRCCPSRASLLTGLYPHQAGVGDMVNTRVQPAYQGYLNQNSVTIAEAMKRSGYNTYMAGKWHVGQAPEHWPVKRGFDRYFGLIDGANSYFGNIPYRPNQTLTIALDDKPYDPGPGYYSTDAYTDYAIKFIDEGQPSGKPFFLYLAYQAPHWPLQALPEDIQKYKGKFMAGWDELRMQRFKRMKASGILPANAVLSPRDSSLRDWNTLNTDEKVRWDDQMAVYAAMIDRMDQNIGRLRKKLRELKQDKNTVIMFLSDNGASHEKINPTGFTPQMFANSQKMASEPGSFTAYGIPGANVSNTPFRMFKHWEYEGGTSTPFIAYGPGIVKPGIKSDRPAHLIDLMPTCLGLAAAPYPKQYRGNTITPAEGVSLLPVFRGNLWKGHPALFFEHEGSRAVRQGDWKLVSEFPANKWQLYNIRSDRAEIHDLGAKNPAKVKELVGLYENWTKHAGVIDFDKLEKKRSD
ncbi:sulfatase-like hydrolase/transferase [Pedobacter sp. HMF7056]|uniref:Sulfatase-like hydrolase/transferase n=2 Tax=Hufsiella ginkgonis TaxID=2695274 RepID=A0A7K1XWX2_9SPHI|nr:sulfatase-like hydrolase/transferase [Hufsiella ginkgonis]